MRLRYERRESRQDDLTIISDLRQVIAEQEKDLACLNEEKRYFQMRLINLEGQLDGGGNNSADEDAFEDAVQAKSPASVCGAGDNISCSYAATNNGPSGFTIPPTIHECADE